MYHEFILYFKKLPPVRVLLRYAIALVQVEECGFKIDHTQLCFILQGLLQNGFHGFLRNPSILGKAKQNTKILRKPYLNFDNSWRMQN